MPFILQPPDHAYAIRSVGDGSIVVNETALTASFVVAPDALHAGWRPATLEDLTADDLAFPLSLDPEVILLGTGRQQRFPPAAVLAACLTRGVGIEVMSNAAAARTFSVLANEGRRVVAAFLLG